MCIGIDLNLQVAERLLDHLGITITDPETVNRSALQWALRRGFRSGPDAWQFARD